MSRSIKHPLVARAAVILAVALGIMLALHGGPSADPGEGFPDRPRPYHDAPDLQDDFQILQDPDFRVIPLQEAAKIAARRYKGRLIAARLLPPRPDERDRGVELVHELRLLTERRDVLLIRLDARNGAFLEVAGSGLTQARRKKDDRK